MGRQLKIFAVCALFLLVVSLPASASSVCNFSSVKLTGNSGSNVSGTFTFDPSTNSFSNISMSFNGGVFNNVLANDPKGGKGIYLPGQGYLFTWITNVKGDWLWCSMLFNPSTGQFQEWGGISNGNSYGRFDYLSVPEGGTELTYLMLSGIAVFGGILVSNKQRRTTRSSQSG